jgi:hypothetical protein
MIQERCAWKDHNALAIIKEGVTRLAIPSNGTAMNVHV